ncbi:hypothetical protein Ple7327_0444 [Pleurocapsa sp. PCC 7327]|uniref:hypothetical protein n=1 Tax=Pleurocapsa sp. PCC 7327 TaxID=118163 RepID=UPI00029F8AA1|nr:hypothetical protein [Pleurocapsa sp. PCC 7327]AFY75900.1 hypothetical protein Ple7327_0444 [Pleurocapsa sp. PCC 7327]
MNKTTTNSSKVFLTDEDWFNLGKADAWAGKPMSPPEDDSRAATLYQLGYSEGKIERPTSEKL